MDVYLCLLTEGTVQQVKKELTSGKIWFFTTNVIDSKKEQQKMADWQMLVIPDNVKIFALRRARLQRLTALKKTREKYSYTAKTDNSHFAVSLCEVLRQQPA